MLVILTTHPIQYQVPLWQALAKDGRVPFEVWYLTGHAATASHDREFGKTFAWDLDMLSGYPHRFLDVMPGATPNTFWKCRLKEKLAERLKARGAKALWIQGWQVAAYWQAVWAAKQAGVEVWLRAESNDLAPVPFLKGMVKRLVLGEFFRRVDRFLCIGTGNRRLYQRYGVQADRLYAAPYAVDNARFARQKAETLKSGKTEIRKRWNIPDDAFVVLFCGKFIPKKRPLDLVEAARLLLSQQSALSSSQSVDSISAFSFQLSAFPAKLHLLFVGSGELGGQLREQCDVVFDDENLKAEMAEAKPTTPATPDQPADFSVSASQGVSMSALRPRASFAGFLNQTEISKAYVAADCLVLPSDYGETWGLVVNEAMASGLPCLISDQCGSAADLGVPPNGVFPCGNISALADVLRSMAQRKPILPLAMPPSLTETLNTVVELAALA